MQVFVPQLRGRFSTFRLPIFVGIFQDLQSPFHGIFVCSTVFINLIVCRFTSSLLLVKSSVILRAGTLAIIFRWCLGSRLYLLSCILDELPLSIPFNHSFFVIHKRVDLLSIKQVSLHASCLSYLCGSDNKHSLCSCDLSRANPSFLHSILKLA